MHLKILSAKWRQFCLSLNVSKIHTWTRGTVNSRYIAVVYIAELDISRSYVEPHFFAKLFHEFCRRAPRVRYFTRNRDNSLHPIRGRQFFAKSAHRDSLCSRSQETIFHKINSSLPVNAGWNPCCAMDSHARRSIDTSIVSQSRVQLTHWGRVTHICVGKLNIIGSDNGLSPGRRQAIIWTNVRILSIRPLATNFNELLIGIQTFSFTKMYLKMSSAKWRPYCLGLNVLIQSQCKSRLQPANLGINNTLNQIVAVWPRCLHPPSCPIAETVPQQIKRAIVRYSPSGACTPKLRYIYDAKRFKIQPQICEITASWTPVIL